MSYSTKTITTTGLQLLTAGARDVVSTAVVTIQGIGTASATFQSRHNTDGNGTNALVPSNVAYTILGGASVAAGTAITADGRFEVNTDASDLYLNVTSLSGPFTCYITSLQGGGGGGSSGGGGGGGAVTVANGANVAEGTTTDAPQAVAATTSAATMVTLLKGIYNNTASASSNTVVPTTTVDPTNTFTQPTGDAAGRSIFTVTQGLVADGATASGVSSVLIGGIDSGGLARSGLMSLLTATPAGASSYGLTTFSQIAGISSGNTVRGIATGSNIVDGGSGATALMTGQLVWNGATYDRALGSLAAGRVVKPYALPGSDWQYAGVTGGITNNTGVTMKAAAGAGVRNYVTAVTLFNTSATATEVVINDGAAGTAMWRGYVFPTTSGFVITFPTPLKGTANTLTEVLCVTTGAAVRVSAQGYAAA